MSAQTQTTLSNTFTPVRFGLVDIVGISVSTLLFTVVWVGVFSVFLPDKTSTIFSDGLKQSKISQTSHSELHALNTNLQIAKDRVTESVHGGIVSLLSVIQTGGSARSVSSAFGKAVTKESVAPLARVFPDTAVLGAATSDVLRESNVPEELFKQSYVYINTVSFGLLDQIDKQFDVAVNSVT